MMPKPNICLLGDVVLDVSRNSEDTKLRLGGIVHAARALWALGIEYDVAFFCPNYLDELVSDYLNKHGANNLFKLGSVSGAPYVFLIGEEKETGDQGYDFLLRDEIKIDYNDKSISIWNKESYKNLLAITGNYDLKNILKSSAEAKISIDIANNINEINQIPDLSVEFKNLFISTSSTLFNKHYSDDFLDFCNLFQGITDRVILKENRGGTRGYEFNTKRFFSCGSQTQPIEHSVGVGDVFDATFIAFQYQYGLSQTLSICSWIALEYASTKYVDDFKREANRIINSDLSNIEQLPSVSLPWEKRKEHQIYVAAPDFNDVETNLIDTLCNALTYHNFTPMRPVKLFGEMEIDASKERKKELYNKDVALLQNCSLIIAVLLFNDPGTLIEIGIGSGQGIPTIVWDPYNIANNCMISGTPDLLTSDLDHVISETFNQLAKMENLNE
ncbi:MAG: nucleoside 2-deoxyribosyltransferase [Balneolaceae bacterium]